MDVFIMIGTRTIDTFIDLCAAAAADSHGVLASHVIMYYAMEAFRLTVFPRLFTEPPADPQLHYALFIHTSRQLLSILEGLIGLPYVLADSSQWYYSYLEKVRVQHLLSHPCIPFPVSAQLLPTECIMHYL